MSSEKTNHKYDVFISHRSDHKPWVETLARNLKTRGYDVFLDLWELVPGYNFADGLHKGLRRSRKGILVATPDAVDSGWVREEYDAMLSRKNRESSFTIIPLVLGDIPDLPFLENVHYVDFRDPAPQAYRRAFYHLLCGLRDQLPGSEVVLNGELEVPEPINHEPQALQSRRRNFLDDIFDVLHINPILMLLAQADRAEGDVLTAILNRAQGWAGTANSLHVTPPYSGEAEVSAYFARLGRQCGFPVPTPSALDWEDSLTERLELGEKLFVLVSGFENGSDTGRRELAGVLRTLNERHPQTLRIVLSGGERLAELKYAAGDLSLLNHADVLEWPEYTSADVLNLQQRYFPDLPSDETEAQRQLELCGGHPRLLRQCMQMRWHNPGLETTDYLEGLKESHFAAQLFTPFRQDSSAQEWLCAQLEKPDLGPAQVWPNNGLLRRLYWKNLLAVRKRRYVWRCDLLREVGREVLG